MRRHCFASRRDGPPDPLTWLAALKISCALMQWNVVVSMMGPSNSVLVRISAGVGCRCFSLFITSVAGSRTDFSEYSSRNFSVAPIFPSNTSLENILVTSPSVRFFPDLIFLCVALQSRSRPLRSPLFHMFSRSSSTFEYCLDLLVDDYFCRRRFGRIITTFIAIL